MDHPVLAELEAKLLVSSPATLRAIARLESVGAYRLRPRDTVQLHSVYVDTPDYVLARHRIAFRVRRAAGQWEATIKWEGRSHGGLHERPELTVPLERRPRFPLALPAPLRIHLSALAAGRPMQPILISDVRRRRIDVLAGGASDGAALAELAIDRVRLRVADADAVEDRYSEIEIERTGGQRRDVAAVARELRRMFDLRPSRGSKFERGLALVHRSPVPHKTVEGVRAEDSVEQVARKMVGRHLRRLRQHDPGTRLGEDPEALHDMRVATRRLRAVVRAFKPGFARRLQMVLLAELRWLGGLLGGVRDLDVQLRNVRDFGAASPPGQRPCLEQFQAYLEVQRAGRRAEMLAGLDSQRYFDLLLLLEQFAMSPPRRRPSDPAAREPIAVAGRTAIKKAFQRVCRRGDRIHAAAPAPEDLHALRIKAKRLRYLLEFLRDLTGKPGRRLVKQLVQLQDLLGAYHDAVVAADVVRAYVDGSGKDIGPSSLLALGALVGSDLRLAERKRSEFQRTWQRFLRRRTLNESRSVLQQLRASAPASPRSAARPRAPTPMAASGGSA